ncbi:MAG: hypothetical protein WBO10_11570 [Pyrinomonadaceae bacterium]
MRLAFIMAAALFGISAVASPANAQDCTEAALAKKPGIVKASGAWGSSKKNVSPADLARETTVVGNIHKMIAASYAPVGVVGSYGNNFDGGNDAPGKNKVADIFGYTMYLLKYLCDKNSPDKSKFYVNVASPTSLKINANLINEYGLYATDISDNTFRGYLLMKHRPQKINGFYFLGDEFSGDSRTKQKYYTWLITYDDALPFSYVSRKEYLQLSKIRLQKTIQENGNGSGYYTEFVKRIDDTLKRPDSELSQPAIVKRNDEEQFTGFVEENSPGSYFLVRHNPAYYRKGLPKSAAQFFTVVFSVLEGEPNTVYVDNINAIKKVVNFNFLRNMLGK